MTIIAKDVDTLPPSKNSCAVETEEEQLYAKRKKIHPRRITGIFSNMRLLSAWLLLGWYYGLPWLQWNDRQAVLFDLPNRKFYLFDLVLWPQDFIFLAWLLVLAALSLFFFTAVGGRLWCGYACPQTVWTKVFMWMERITEGERQQRLKLDKAPWNTEKIIRRGGKHVLWLGFGFATGLTFVGYFTPIIDLVEKLLSWNLGGWEAFWVLFYGFATYGNAGWLREQVCIYMCPYARFQGAMFDRNTLIISYDSERGEARGSRKRGEDPAEQGLGDCLDCTLCVQVCPTGIDIRDGLQYECIACAACIDACDQVMEKMQYPKGLIRYTTENALEHKPSRILRPRIVIYGILLTILFMGFFYALYLRTPLGLDVIRDRNALYQLADNGQIQNVYTIKILNKDEAPHRYRLSIAGLDAATIVGDNEFSVGGGQIASIPLRISIPEVSLSAPISTIWFEIVAVDNPRLATREKVQFIGPVGD